MKNGQLKCYEWPQDDGDGKDRTSLHLTDNINERFFIQVTLKLTNSRNGFASGQIGDYNNIFIEEGKLMTKKTPKECEYNYAPFATTSFAAVVTAEL